MAVTTVTECHEETEKLPLLTIGGSAGCWGHKGHWRKLKPLQRHLHWPVLEITHALRSALGRLIHRSCPVISSIFSRESFTGREPAQTQLNQRAQELLTSASPPSFLIFQTEAKLALGIKLVETGDTNVLFSVGKSKHSVNAGLVLNTKPLSWAWSSSRLIVAFP